MEKDAGAKAESSTGAALTLMLIYVSGEYRRIGEHLAAKLCLLAIEAAGGGRGRSAAIRKVLGSDAAERLRNLEEIRKNGMIRAGEADKRKKDLRD